MEAARIQTRGVQGQGNQEAVDQRWRLAKRAGAAVVLGIAGNWAWMRLEWKSSTSTDPQYHCASPANHAAGGNCKQPATQIHPTPPHPTPHHPTPPHTTPHHTTPHHTTPHHTTSQPTPTHPCHLAAHWRCILAPTCSFAAARRRGCRLPPHCSGVRRPDFQCWRFITQWQRSN